MHGDLRSWQSTAFMSLGRVLSRSLISQGPGKFHVTRSSASRPRSLQDSRTAWQAGSYAASGELAEQSLGGSPALQSSRPWAVFGRVAFVCSTPYGAIFAHVEYLYP